MHQWTPHPAYWYTRVAYSRISKCTPVPQSSVDDFPPANQPTSQTDAQCRTIQERTVRVLWQLIGVYSVLMASQEYWVFEPKSHKGLNCND